MSPEQAIVALDRGGGHLRLPQQAIEEAARARAGFAVDEANARARDVLRFADAAGIAGGGRETLFEGGGGDHHPRAGRESATDEGKGEFPRFLVGEMRALDV